MTRLLTAAVAGLLAAATASAGITTVTQAHEGWGGPTFDFTQTRTVGGTDYFGWDPLTIDASWSSGTFTFDITMPRALTGGDNFDLVIDWNNDGVDSNGDFLVHYAAGNFASGGWDSQWDAKVYSSGWQHAGSNGLADLTQTTVNGSTSDQQNFQVSFAGNSDISYQWLSPLGDEGFPESWTGEAAVISFWNGGDPSDNVPVLVPAPGAVLLGLMGCGAIGAFRRRLA